MKSRILFIGILIILLFLFLISCTSGTRYDAFATCLTEQGATMYGTFWCSHCQEQKKLFGDSFQYVNYIECSLPDGKSQTELCAKKGINGYPTWELENGTRVEGIITLNDFSQRTGCLLPS